MCCLRTCCRNSYRTRRGETSYTIAHSKRRPEGSVVFECALATVTLSLINLLCYIQHLGYAEMAIYKSQSPVSRGEPLGGLNVQRCKPREYNYETIKLVSEIGEITGSTSLALMCGSAVGCLIYKKYIAKYKPKYPKPR